MHTRRSAIAGLAGVTLVAAAPASFAADDGLPSAKTVAGKPPYMDYGDGVKVPLSKGAFATLWEGPNYWLTFGFGSASVGDRAKELASHRAAGAMRYLLLTLAFAPDRLEKVPGNGWRQKVETPANYVIGELDLPGRPGVPATDAAMGFGNADANLFVTAGGGPGIGPGTSDTAGTFSGMNRAAMLKGINAFCSYIIMKKDLSLNDVRARARQVVL
ncbi:hypothetical protein [Rhizomicrobium electricum]|uniref:Uncharacterized protein n=1 Tax=Rhizomicrobium electricum TaxID=480070 RepID=A0ABP3Q4M4_9PROT|nr:hypothetical protein [Rhizomicrobium electricum]NIJ49328.1 hypothetical protein [Rhizomicrobium electricum]